MVCWRGLRPSDDLTMYCPPSDHLNLTKIDFHNKEAFQNMISKLSNPDQSYQNFVKILAKHHFEVKAVIQVSQKY